MEKSENMTFPNNKGIYSKQNERVEPENHVPSKPSCLCCIYPYLMLSSPSSKTSLPQTITKRWIIFAKRGNLFETKSSKTTTDDVWWFQTLGVQKAMPRSTPLVSPAPESEGGTGGKGRKRCAGCFPSIQRGEFQGKAISKEVDKLDMVELQLNHWSNHCLTEIKDYTWLSKDISFLGGWKLSTNASSCTLHGQQNVAKAHICIHYHMYTYIEHTHIYGWISPMWSHVFSQLTQNMILVCWIYPTKMPVTTKIITFFPSKSLETFICHC